MSSPRQLESPGLAAAQLAAFYYPRHHVGAFASDTPRLAQVELHIDHPPRVLTGRRSAITTPSRRSRWRPPASCRSGPPADGAVRPARCSSRSPSPTRGSPSARRVRVIGMLQRPAPAMNPGQFDWAAYYREQRILASLHVSHAGNIEILGVAGARAARVTPRVGRGRCWRPGSRAGTRSTTRCCGHCCSATTTRSSATCRTSSSAPAPATTWRSAACTSRCSAGSSSRVCRLLCLPPRVSAWAMIAFVMLYGLVALPSPPVVRSVRAVRRVRARRRRATVHRRPATAGR